jgi:hypothetical protein
MAGNDNHLKLGPFLPDPFQSLHAPQLGEEHVEKNQVDILPPQDIQAQEGVLGGAGLIFFILQD